MIQPFGIFLILLGAMMWHIASSSAAPKNIRDVWRDILKTMHGETLS